MNPDTGAIGRFETEADARAAGHTIPLTEDEARKLLLMNRRERQLWARERGTKKVPTMEQCRRVADVGGAP